ncbi:MAG TPA: hypothetical protein DCG75_03265 [Bacteroidales bacterium]|jgi:hypothetical protein|nr:hypothetical protein [Bacteroidales bacterium]
MKKTLFWILAVIITVGSAVYQKKTGPTYPKRLEINLLDNQLKFTLPRSGVTDQDLLIQLPITDTAFSVNVNYRRFPLNESFTAIEFTQQNNMLIAYLPQQAPAGKLEYYLTFKHSGSEIINTEHVVARFKGAVPAWALIPHILFIFTAMLLSNLAGLFALGKEKKHVFYGNLTLILLLIGGMIFGPIVQYYAFGEFWTGVPFGWDLTDNKTLIAVIFWVVAVLANRKNPKYRYTLIATIVLLLIFSIPHSLFGSELDYSSGEVTTGFIQLFF